MTITFITGNEGKAAYVAQYLGRPIARQSMELEELQSLDIRKIAEHKAREAYSRLKKPVLVDDVALGFDALGGALPGPFIKWFLKELKPSGLCKTIDILGSRGAVAKVCMAYFDGTRLKFFEGSVSGRIASKPRIGIRGYGWDVIFIPNGSDKTYSEMSADEIHQFSVRANKIFPKLKQFLDSLNNK